MPDGASSESLTTDRVFDLLADAERRRALSALRSADGSVQLGDLAAETVARDECTDPSTVTADERERTAAALHHKHLPRLADSGVVCYDPAESRVELTETVEELTPYFEIIDAYE
ncbi:DUF7344 domain-containing protein [Halorussus amylolyticus]|uniref:DUF7344 domain-containing protein n=1 Tax=Halorussus amylolyticus TaxID=1126242 RepID=UPI001044D130|nr:hypothetical protein [Halorussus amylolyticus]